MTKSSRRLTRVQAAGATSRVGGTQLRAVAPPPAVQSRTTRLLTAPGSEPPIPAVSPVVSSGPTPDEAARDIREILGRTLAKGMEEVGAYLLRTFYDDDIALYRARSSLKAAPLRALVERCGTMELPVSATFLSTSIRMAAIARQLPPSASFRKLPVSHRVELLRLPEREIEAVAARAIARELPVRELREHVSTILTSTRARQAPPRRPASRALVKLLKALQRLLPEDAAPGGGPAGPHFTPLDDTERRELAVSFDRVIERLGRIRAQISDE